MRAIPSLALAAATLLLAGCPQTTEIETPDAAPGRDAAAPRPDAAPATEETPEECSDLEDNDGDGFTDCGDPTCMSIFPCLRPDAAVPPGPDSGADAPDAGAAGPDGATADPDASEPGSDAGQPASDAAQPGPDAAQPGPDASQPGPDAGPVCVRETKAQFCARLALAGKVCGPIAHQDNCSGQPRTEDCGSCANGRTCSADSTCTGACLNLTPQQFCQANSKNCGSFTGMACDVARTENCGTCAAGLCINNVCESCTDSETDTAFCFRMASLGKECGVVTGNGPCLNAKTVQCGYAACVAGEACDAATNQCAACAAETPAQFCARQKWLGKECGSITANDACSGAARTVDCGTSACTGGATCSANRCTGGAPANDACTAAVDITAAAMPVTGTTRNAANDSAGACATFYPQNGGDVVYKFTLGGSDHRSATLSVTPSSATPDFYTTVSVRSDCASVATEVGCTDSGFAGDSLLKINDLAPGTYFVIVDGEDGSSGDFQLTLTFGAAIPPPANDSCAAPQALSTATLDGSGNGTLTVTGDTSAAANDSSSLGSCGGSGGDVVYSLTTGAEKDVTVTLRFADTSQTPVTYLRKGACTTATASDELKCATGTSGVGTLIARKVPAGQLYIWADGYSGSKGAFTLTVTLANPAPPPSNDACGASGASATPIALNGSGSGSAAGDTSLATTDDAAGSCHPSGTGRDVVYSIDTTGLGERNLTATVDFLDGVAYAALYLRKVCDSAAAGDEVGCEYPYSETGTLLAKHLPAGKYYLWVDSGAGDEGAFNLAISAVVPPPPAANDSCRGTPTAISLDANGHGTITGDTLAATDDDARGSCETTSGNDLVYSFDTTGKGVRNVTAGVSFTDTTVSASVYLWKACGTAADELACGHPYTSDATAVAKRLPEGRYYVWVDQYASGEGPFTLTIDAVVPPVSPCGTAPALDFVAGAATATGTTVGKINYTTSTCAGDGSNDQVHKMVLTADQKVTLTVTPDAASTTYLPVVYLRQDCESELAADQLACDAAFSAGDPATVTLKNLAAGTYYVWVDGDADFFTAATGSEGAYTLQATLAAPVLPPSNDTCGTSGANAIALTKGAAATAGDTSDATANYGTALSAACYADMDSYNAKGKDLVYAYTPSAAGDFTIEVVTTAFDVCVWYTTGACGGDGATCVHAADAAIGSGTETLVVPGAAAGTTYFIYVDSYSSTAGGAYTIAIK